MAAASTARIKRESFTRCIDLNQPETNLLHQDGTQLPKATADGKKFSGKFAVRVEPALHRRLVLKAQAAGESLNTFCVKTLAKA